MIKAPTQSVWLSHITKGVAVTASTGAAVVSIATALYSYGVIGKSESHQSIGNIGAAWVRLRPAVDTASAIGDTIHFAATIADKKGSILVGATPIWTTGDSTVAIVGSDGAVIARGPGSTTLNVVVGSIVSSARVIVRQQVAAVTLETPARDSTLALLEGGQAQLRVHPVDSRGHVVNGRSATWHSDDSTVANVDAHGFVTAQGSGRGMVSVHVDDVSSSIPVSVTMTAAQLVAVAGAGQHALAAHALPQHVMVRATNRKGAPAPGKLVTFRVRGGQGKADPVTATTDADGRARTQWTLGDEPGAQALLATVENVDSAVVVTAESEPIAANTRVVPLVERLRARAGTSAGDSVGVRITDSIGRAVAGIPVRWDALGGKVEAVDARTDSSGVARARWTLASTTGTQRLRASVGVSESRIVPATITATALAGAPAKVVVTSGDRQRAVAGHLLPHGVVIRVVDAGGNGVEETSVALAPTGGTIADSAMVTDSSGYAKVRWTLGRTAGEYALAARVTGVDKPLKVEAHATPAGPANLTFDDVPDRSAHPGTKRLTAFVADVYGNPVADRKVSFNTHSGTVTPARAVTDSRGRVALKWVMGHGATDQRLKGAVPGTDVAGAYVAQAASEATVAAKGKKAK